MRSKRNKKQNPEGVEEWYVTYGDVMALLLTFFVLLFSFSEIDAKKWEELVRSFNTKAAPISFEMEKDSAIESLLEQKSGVNSSIIEKDEIKVPENEDDKIIEDINTEEESGKDETSQLDQDKEIDQSEDLDHNGEIDQNIEINERFTRLYEDLVSLSERNSIDTKFELIRTDDQIVIRFSNNLLFDSGSATLDNVAKVVIKDISDLALLYVDIIDELKIEGNTDNVPISSNRFKDNFDLSLQRALVVLFYFKDEAGFPPQKLVPLGYGEYNPVKPNTSEENKALNRRTDFVIVRRTIKEEGNNE